MRGNRLLADNFGVAIWIEETDEVFFASMAGTPSRARSDVNNNNKIFRIVLKDTPAGSSFADKVYGV